MKISGNIQKMHTRLADTVEYQLPFYNDSDPQLVDMNALIGQPIKLSHNAEINCIACGRKTRKSFNQGFCYPVSSHWHNATAALSSRKNATMPRAPAASRNGVNSTA